MPISKKEYDVTCSLVTYQNTFDDIKQAIDSFLNTDLKIKLFVIDNSPTDTLKVFSDYNKNIEYIFNNKNVGFGAGHNIAIRKSIELSKCHLILNPDIEYKKGNLEKLFNHIVENKDIGLIAPKVYYQDGSIQYLCRKLPTPFDFFAKRLIPKLLLPLFQQQLDEYEFKHFNYDKTIEIPFISGCFMLIRTDVFSKVGLFDENIFMYTEDIDISRRIGKDYKTIFFPEAEVFHGYARESAKNWKLFIISIKSAIYYFNKWGWFWDKSRAIINNKALNQLK
jgi:GT2 family glycosyltransferase